MAESPSASRLPDSADPASPRCAARIPPELLALAQNGAAISLASCTAEGEPLVGLGVGCIVAPDGTLRVMIGRAANVRLIAAIVAGRAVAVTFIATRDHSSFQIKAARAQYLATGADTCPEIDRQATLLREGLVELGFLPEQAAGYAAYDSNDLGTVVICPERVFLQTPGPGAGAELTA
jgi:hypothetical protein